MKPADRPYLTGDLHARVIIGNDKAPLVSPWREKHGDEPEGALKCRYYGANAGQTSVTSNIRALFYVNAAFFLGRLLRRIVLILLRFVSRTRRLSSSLPNKVSSNQLVPSAKQERLR